MAALLSTAPHALAFAAHSLDGSRAMRIWDGVCDSIENSEQKYNEYKSKVCARVCVPICTLRHIRAPDMVAFELSLAAHRVGAPLRGTVWCATNG